jgi:mitogen-activated protein kinase kinase kinase
MFNDPSLASKQTNNQHRAFSPQKDHHSTSLRSTSTDNVLKSKYAQSTRSTTLETPKTARFNGHVRGMSSDVSSSTTASILPMDKALIRVIYDNGHARVLNIDNAHSIDDIMTRTLRKYNLNEAHWKNYCFWVLDNLEPNPALCRKINDAEVMRICNDPTRIERNRLILRKIHQGEPDDDQLKTAASIASQIQSHQVKNPPQISTHSHSHPANNIFIPMSDRSKSKIESLTGEPLPSITYPQSPGSMEIREQHLSEQLRRANDPPPLATPRPRMKEVFGGRPPSNLIAQDLSAFFPDYDAEQIDRTVRMSIRRSRRISRAASRLSMASNYSVMSMLRDAPPVPNLPAIPDAWLGSQEQSQHAKGLRPLSVLRLGDRGHFRDSIASSVLQPLDEELSPSVETPISATTDIDGSGTLRSYYNDYDDGGRSSVANSAFDGESPDTLNHRMSQMLTEDSEDEDEELNEYLEEDSWDNIKYMKGALIGQGSFGSVYLALHAITGELMAVKQVEMPGNAGGQVDTKKNTMVEALKHEIGLLRELKHSNIVSYLGSNTEGTFLNIFLEYVPGGSVAKMLVTYGPLGESLIANFVRQILKGLAYLHSKDIIHRDIKGANILVDHQGSVKISDFGISKRVEASTLMGGSSNAKKAGQRVSLQGSVFWMAPEVVKQTAYTRKADIWSLGCLIVEMLTGQRPHPNCSQLQAIFKIGRGSEEARPTVPELASDSLKKFLDTTFDIEYDRRPEADELLSSEWLKMNTVGEK